MSASPQKLHETAYRERAAFYLPLGHPGEVTGLLDLKPVAGEVRGVLTGSVPI